MAMASDGKPSGATCVQPYARRFERDAAGTDGSARTLSNPRTPGRSQENDVNTETRHHQVLRRRHAPRRRCRSPDRCPSGSRASPSSSGHPRRRGRRRRTSAPCCSSPTTTRTTPSSIAVYPGVPTPGSGDIDELHDADADTGVRTGRARRRQGPHPLRRGRALRPAEQHHRHTLTGDAAVTGSLNVGSGTLAPSTRRRPRRQSDHRRRRARRPDRRHGRRHARRAARPPSAASWAAPSPATQPAPEARQRASTTSPAPNGQSIANGRGVVKALGIAIGSGKTVTDMIGFRSIAPTVVLATITNNYGVHAVRT